MMKDIEAIAQINFVQVFLGLFTILIAVLSVLSLLEKISDKFGVEFRFQRKKKEEHDLLVSTVNRLSELEKTHEEDTYQSIRHDEMIREDVKKLTDMFIDKSIDDMRYEILDFASSLSSGRKFSQEQFEHVMRINSKYMQILEENNMTNGFVEASMEVITEMYKERLKNGF